MSHSDDSHSYTKGFLFGTLIGAVAGAITALLLAPKSGNELRRDLARKSQELYDMASDYIANLEKSVGPVVTSTVNESKIRAQRIIDSARNQAESLIKNAESVLHDAKTKASTAAKSIENKIENVKEAAKAGKDAFSYEMKEGKSELKNL